MQKQTLACPLIPDCRQIDRADRTVIGHVEDVELRRIKGIGATVAMQRSQLLPDVFGALFEQALFGGGQNGSIYAKNEFGGDVVISYNTFLQQIEFEVETKEKMIKELMNVDSFILKSDGDNIKEDIKFINAAHTPSDEKCFFQKVSEGLKFDLYKKYSSRLEIISTNILQSELRQFALSTDYFYLDKTKKAVKRLKIGKSAIVKQFKEYKDLSFYVDDSNLNGDTENGLKEIFRILNE